MWRSSLPLGSDIRPGPLCFSLELLIHVGMFVYCCCCCPDFRFFSLLFGNIPAPFYFKLLNLCILFRAYVYGVVPLRFKHTFTLCTLGAAEDSRRCGLPELH